MKLVVLVALTVAACGRLRFDPEAGGDAPAPDTANACGHTFCDDFDRPDLQGPWDAIEHSTGSTLSIDAQSALTPGSFLLGLPAPNLENGFLVTHFPLTTTKARIELQLAYASTDPGTAEIDLVQLKWDDLPAPCTSFGYFLVRDGTGPFDLQETYGGCGGNEDTALLDLANTDFHHIVMEVTFGAEAAGAMVRVDIDGVNKVLKPTSHSIPPSPLTLRLGGGAVRNMTAPWQIRYDDVLVDLE